MKLGRLNHVGIATPSIERSVALYRDLLGATHIHDPFDLAEHSRFFLIWGRNPAVTNIHMMPLLKAARARGAVAVLVDPVATKTARFCDRAVHPRPGSDGHLAIGMAKVMLARRPVDRERIAGISDHFEDYLRTVDAVAMDDVVRRTDLPLETIEWLALAYFDTRPATILQGIGLQQYTRGAQTYRLIAALGMLSGNIGVPGGGVNFANWPWPRMRHVVAEARRTAPPRTVPVSRLAEGLAATTDPPITLGFFMGSNLVNQMPDAPGARAALGRLEFSVCVDQFLTEQQRRGERCVLVITGKGRNSRQQVGVLREKIPQWLARGPSARRVLAFVTARPCDGGEGALYVLLRRERAGKARIDVVAGGGVS